MEAKQTQGYYYHSQLVEYVTVRDKLQNAGWDPIDDNLTPKQLYDLILQIIPAASEDALILYNEFSKINRVSYDSLSSFETRITYLKTRLEALPGKLLCRKCPKGLLLNWLR